MSTSKHINKICIAVIFITLVLTMIFCFGKRIGIGTKEQSPRYESTIFDTSYVHKIDIVMNDWDSFIENCENEEYSNCTVVIDGQSYKNIAIRAKGNTSLSSVKSMDSERYSFKLEFDHYEDAKMCDGLDKLCLNNLIQDNTMMKDYLVYQMMKDFGVDTPLCSYAYITVNGEDWGLYLAVEGVEDSFLSRNYGSDVGELYKPDSMSFGGGRGNGRDFDIKDFDFGDFEQANQNFNAPGNKPNGFGGFGGMGSDDVKLKYIDNNVESYSNIFNNVKTDISEKDKNRLINSLKNLSKYENLNETVVIDEVMRYFVVHNFVVNGDSYTGAMTHNYYLHEYNGRLSMIPWDYNLAFGTFQGGNGSETVNISIDSPVNGGSVDDRPMLGWIFSDEEYTNQYHELFAEFIIQWMEDDKLVKTIEAIAEMIRPYVEKDPTKFCSMEQFELGIKALSQFVSLRLTAVDNQLHGDMTIIETEGLQISDMGTMNVCISR